MIGISSVVQLVVTLIAGPLVDRRGARLAMRIGSGSYLAAAALFLISSSLLAVGLARVLQGIGIGLMLPATFSLVPSLVSTRFTGAAIGMLGAFGNVSLALGPPLGLFLLSRGAATLFGAALAAGAMATALSFALRVGLSLPEPGRLLKFRWSWMPLYAVTFLSVIYWGVVTAFLAIEVPRTQVTNVGWFFTADAIAVMVARIPAGYLADRLGSRWLMVAGIAITGAGIVLLRLDPSFTTLVLAGCATGVGAASLLPVILLELTHRSSENDRGTAMALYNTSFAAAVGLGSIGGAILISRLQFGGTLLLTLAACLGGIPIVLAATRQIENR